MQTKEINNLNETSFYINNGLNFQQELSQEQQNIILSGLFYRFIDFDIENLSNQEKVLLIEGIRVLKNSLCFGFDFTNSLLKNNIGLKFSDFFSFIKELMSLEMDKDDESLMNIVSVLDELLFLNQTVQLSSVKSQLKSVV